MESTSDKFKTKLVERILIQEEDVICSTGYGYVSTTKHSLIYYFATSVIEGRWYIAEPILKENEFWWNLYVQHFDMTCKCVDTDEVEITVS